MNPKLLLIGLDGGTFSILDPLIEDGVMPALNRLIESGTRAELASVIPPLTPPAWTSLMTGRPPGHHNIFDFLRFDLSPGNRQLRVLDASDVGCRTIWSIFAKHGLKTTVLNFPMTFPARDLNGNVVPGWVPWRHLRLACQPKGLYDRLTAAVPGFNPRELAMDMALEERVLEGCHRETEYESLIQLHIRRERQWFAVARYLMREDPADVTAILFDGVDKLQHFCWRFLDPQIYSAASSATAGRVREWCLRYFRDLDSLLAELVAAAGKSGTVVIASDHGFGSTVEVFYLNEWLHQRGYLAWAEAGPIAQKHSETLGLGTMARRFYEVDWDRTTAYCPTPSSNGIFIAPPAGDGKGVSASEYESFRRELTDALLQFRDGGNGEPVVRRIWTREEAFAGPYMAGAPDLTLSLRDGGLVSILPSDVLLKRRSEPAGAHRPNGILIAAGPAIPRGNSISSLSILDVAPVLLYAAGLPVPEDLEGRVPEALFDRHYFGSHPVAFEAPTDQSPTRPLPPIDPRMEMEVMRHLRALGYVE